MKRLMPLGFRGQLTAAMCLVAIGSVSVSALISDGVLRDHVARAAMEERRYVAAVAARDLAMQYERDGRLRPEMLMRARQLVSVGNGDLTVLGPSDTPLVGEHPDRWSQEHREQAVIGSVRVEGERVATVAVRPASGALSRGADASRRIDSEFFEAHLLAGGVAIVVALLMAILFSGALTRPLRLLTSHVRRAERGQYGEPLSLRGARGEVSSLVGAFNRLMAGLSRQEELRRRSSAFLAHELRTPMTGVLTRLEAMAEGMLPADRDNLAATRHDAERLRALVENIEQLHQAEQPLLRQRLDMLELEMIIGRRVAAVAGAFVAKGISMNVKLQSALVEGDPMRLEQVIDNLLSNALRYTESGGLVSVRLWASPGHALLEVTDTGVGIQPEDRERVFEPFWRAEAARAHSREGSGLGLAIVRDLVEAHGGHIGLRSQPGAGTSVTIALPVSAEAAASEHEADGSGGEQQLVA